MVYTLAGNLAASKRYQRKVERENQKYSEVSFEKRWCFVFILLVLLSLDTLVHLWGGMGRGRKIEDMKGMKELISLMEDCMLFLK